MSDVNLMNFGTQLGITLGIGSFAGGILAAAIMMGLVCIPVLYFTRGKNPMLSFIFGMVMLGFSTSLGWVPAWLFAIIALLTALLFGNEIAKRF
jgi:hypothetical protein